jgi:hypothetical protein
MSRTRHVYGHEVLMSLQMRAKFFGTHLLHCFVSDIGLRTRRIAVYSLENNLQLCQAISFMSAFDYANFPVTVANCISSFESHLNSVGVIQEQIYNCDYPQAGIHCISRTKCRPTAL